mmetsp:Transcript_48747/g.99142  ORF Transcript_48747/g.99142 Transcript_48747/m.99142 type:complete len:201 (-) Transcript_48747:1043-1645(-)
MSWLDPSGSQGAAEREPRAADDRHGFWTTCLAYSWAADSLGSDSPPPPAASLPPLACELLWTWATALGTRSDSSPDRRQRRHRPHRRRVSPAPFPWAARHPPRRARRCPGWRGPRHPAACLPPDFHSAAPAGLCLPPHPQWHGAHRGAQRGCWACPPADLPVATMDRRSHSSHPRPLCCRCRPPDLVGQKLRRTKDTSET